MHRDELELKTVEVVAGNDGFFSYPSGICYDPAARIFYITGLHGQCVYWLKEDTWEKGELSRSIRWDKENKALEKPLGITMGHDGKVLVTDAAHNTAFRWDPGENTWFPLAICWKSISNEDDGNKQKIDLPSGIAADSRNNIYISDFSNNRILKIGPDNEAHVLVGNGAEQNHDKNVQCNIDKVYGIFHRDGRLYFTDTGNNTIRCFDIENNIVTDVVSAGGPITLSHPVAVTLDPDDNVYICEQRRILYFDRVTSQLSIVIDKDNWRGIMAAFGLKERICYSGAIVVPQPKQLYWVDTIKGLIYRMVYK